MAVTTGTLTQRLTRLLELMRRGDARAKNAVYEQSFDELKGIARRLLAREYRADISATELVNETYLRKLREGKFTAKDRRHFHAIAARAMRSVLVDQARERMAQKRNGGMTPVSIDEPGLKVPDAVGGAAFQDPLEMLALDRELEQLRKMDQLAAETFDLRFFLGYTIEESAGILGHETHRVRENWEFARVWLRDRVDRSGSQIKSD